MLLLTSANQGQCCGIANWTNPPANTNCDSALTYTYTPGGPGTCFPVGTTVVTLVVNDVVNRADTCQFTGKDCFFFCSISCFLTRILFFFSYGD